MLGHHLTNREFYRREVGPARLPVGRRSVFQTLDHLKQHAFLLEHVESQLCSKSVKQFADLIQFWMTVDVPAPDLLQQVR
jgi:hypothetical protein